MGHDIASTQKLSSLRSFAGTHIPDSRLRAALIRAGGDLNTAATILLSNGTLADPDAPIQITAAASQPKERKGNEPEPEPEPQWHPQEQQHYQLQEQNHPQTNAPPVQCDKPRLSSSAVRRLAWRQFYCENYASAVAAVGMEKKEINAFITELWKKVGSKKRAEYTDAVKERLENCDRREGENGLTADDERKEDQVSVEKERPVVNASHADSETPFAPVVDNQLEKFETEQSSSAAVTQPTVSMQSKPDERPHLKRATGDPRQFSALSSHLRQVDESVGWPRLLCSRLCRGALMVSGKRLLSAGDEVVLEVPQFSSLSKGAKAKGKKPTISPTRIVRFSRKGREIGRLSPDISVPLAPALQSGLVTATCKVIEAPKFCRMFAEVFLEVTIYVQKEAFEGKAEQDLVDCGLGKEDVDEDEKERNEAENGVDARRLNVINLISSLKLCQPAEKVRMDFPLQRVQKDGEAGTVSEEGAEAYYRAVEEIDMEDVKSFSPPMHLTCTLREYQRAGVGWMTAREKFGSRAVGKDLSAVDFMLNPLWKRKVFPDGQTFFVNPTTGGLSIEAPIDRAGGPYGGILADEMGLGKTVQCIACIVHDMEQQDKGGSVEIGDGCLSHCREQSASPKADAKVQTAEIEEDEITPVYPEQKNRAKREVSMGSRHTRAQNENFAASGCSKRRRDRRVVNDKKQCSGVQYDDEGSTDGSASDDRDETWTDDQTKATMEEMSDESDDDFYENLPRRKRRKKNGSPQRRRRRKNDLMANGKSALAELMSAAKSCSSGKGGTLIVCPMSLVTQWINELDLHVAPNFLRTRTHYGQSRGDVPSISLQCADVVVTTYGILASECPTNLRDATCNESDSSAEGGPLFKIEWRRVVLDEAHTIKTRTTKWARAAFRLKAERRWCMTGTVIHNHVNDVFSLLHFLRMKPWSSWAFWQRGIVANIESKDIEAQKMAMSLLRDIISSVTLRRKKTTKDTDGNCIVRLPRKTVEIVRLTPSVEESDFYAALYQRSIVQFDTFVRQGKVMNNYASVLELLLRLRQACDHPYLVFAAPGKDSVMLKDKDKMFKQFLDAGSSSQYIENVLKDAESGELQNAKECPLCLDVIDDPVAPKECGHPACRACLTECINRSRKCPVCRTPINSDSIATLPRSTRFAVDLKKRWRSSAKIDALIDDVKVIEMKRAKDDGQAVGKTVVFSQFTSMLDLVGMAFERERIRTLRIDGSVPQTQRAEILQSFASDDELAPDTANVLLVSLKAGGVGLNLVSAAYAILLDIHWNPQIDAQAQDRVHRHGQTRDVIIKRYIIKNSVEEKLLQIQDRKQDIADGALGVATDEDKKQARLSELKLLFSVQ